MTEQVKTAQVNTAKVKTITTPFSYSKINTCENCMYKASRVYIDRSVGEYDLMASVGTEFHSTMEDYAKQCLKAGIQSDQEIALEHIRALRGKLTVDEWDGIAGPASYFILNHQFPKPPFYAERDMAFTRDWKPCGFEDPNAYVRAKIDLHSIHGKTAIIDDYKTGFKVKTIKSPSSLFQLRFYAMMLFLAYPEIEEIDIANHYIRFYDLKVSSTVRRSEIPEFQEYVNDKILSIMTTTEFKPKIQDHCRVCNMSGTCPYFQKYIAEHSDFSLNTQNDAEILASKIFTTGIAMKKWKAQLKGYIKKHGKLIKLGRDMIYGPKVGTNKSINDHLGLAKFLIQEAKIPMADVWGRAEFSLDDVEKLLAQTGKQDILKTMHDRFITTSPRESWGPFEVGEHKEQNQSEEQ